MRLFFSKLGFIHRRLWDRDGLYRLALLFGPAPLVGCAVAAGTWWSLHWASPAPPAQRPDWGKPFQSAQNWSTAGAPHVIQPARPLPSVGVSGRLSGYEAGWRATTHAVEVSPTLNVEIQPTALSAFLVDGSNLNMMHILEAGPRDTKIVGTGSGFLVIRTPGIYALSLRFERPSGPAADCLTRLGFGPHKIVSSYGLAMPGNRSKVFDAARFDLQPGLYPIGWALGCWHDPEPGGLGRITVLIGRPDDQTLQPARPDDIVRPEQSKDVASPTQAPATPAIAAAAATTTSRPQPNAATIDPTSGLDRAVLGRTFQDTLLVNGYKTPLPPGQWALLANATVTNRTHPENTGTMFFLGQIVQKRLVAAVWVEAMRSPGLGFIHNTNCSHPGNLYVADEPDTADHQGCSWIRSYFSADMQQWADKSSHLDQMARTVAESLAAKGVSYPQELITAGFWETQKWGQLTAGYLFSPEKEGIASNVVPAFQDSDWSKSNLQRYPEKVAYIGKLQKWAADFQPKFQAAFAAGKQD